MYAERDASALFVILTPALAWTQAPNRAAIEKQIIANENAINAAFAKNDAATFKKMVDPNGLGLDGSGVQTIADYLKAIGEVKTESGKIDNSRFNWVNDNTVIHMYRWIGKSTYRGHRDGASRRREPGVRDGGAPDSRELAQSAYSSYATKIRANRRVS